MAYLDNHGLETLWNKIKATFSSKVGNSAGNDSVTIKLQNASGFDLTGGSTTIAGATTTSAGVMSKADKSNLDNVTATNISKAGKIWIGNSETGTPEWANAPDTGVTKINAGSNVSVSPATGTGEVTISATDTTYSAGTNVQINGTVISATDTTYESKSAASGGTAVSLVTTGEKYTWNGKQDVITFNTAYNPSSNKAATMTDVLNATAGAVMYQGTLASKNAFEALTNYKKGYYWIVSTAFTTTGGVNLEVGNMVIAHADYNSAFSEANFDFIQGDIEAIPDSVINALS